jgi:hypothetical protein
MPDYGSYLEYKGLPDYETINRLMKSMKESDDFKKLDKTTGKRLYSILVECLENNIRHSSISPTTDPLFQSYISATDLNNKISIKAGNPINKDKTPLLGKKLDHLNSLECTALSCFYDDTINKETIPGSDGAGAGLGFIMIKLKSGNDIEYKFTEIDEHFSFFEINILLNKYIMRKLIFEKTESSPNVILDPERNIFEISGESRPADVGTFYGEILRWFDDFAAHLLKSPNNHEPVVFDFDLEYFNSSSAKYILDFCKQIASLNSKGRAVKVLWKYEEDDTDILEAGQEMSRIAKMPFEFISK